MDPQRQVFILNAPLGSESSESITHTLQKFTTNLKQIYHLINHQNQMTQDSKTRILEKVKEKVEEESHLIQETHAKGKIRLETTQVEVDRITQMAKEKAVEDAKKREEKMKTDNEARDKEMKIQEVLREKEEYGQRLIVQQCQKLREKGITKVEDIVILEDYIEKPYHSDRSSEDVFFTLRRHLREMISKEQGQKDEYVTKLFRDADFKGRGRRMFESDIFRDALSEYSENHRTNLEEQMVKRHSAQLEMKEKFTEVKSFKDQKYDRIMESRVIELKHAQDRFRVQFAENAKNEILAIAKAEMMKVKNREIQVRLQKEREERDR